MSSWENIVCGFANAGHSGSLRNAKTRFDYKRNAMGKIVLFMVLLWFIGVYGCNYKKRQRSQMC